MPNLGSFDSDDSMDGYDTEDTPTAPLAQQAQGVYEDLYGQSSQNDDELCEVEKRLEIASYYRLLLEDSIFNNDNSEAAKKVNDEIRGFVRQRLGVLVGVRRDAPPAAAPVAPKHQFTDEEVVALKAVAAKVIKAPSIVAPKPPVAPEIKKVSTEKAKVTTFDKKKPGRPKKVEPKPSAAPAGIKIGDIVDSKGNVLKKNAKFKTVVAPDGSAFDVELTDQSRSAAAKPPPGKRELEMIMEQQAQAQVANFGPEVNAVVSVITAAKNKEE